MRIPHLLWTTIGAMWLVGVARAEPSRWSEEQAWQWHRNQPWLCGVNFLPSTAGNTTEFWQAESFDEKTIERELGWARETGFNSVRVFFQYLVWKGDPEGAKKRIDRFLALADKHGLSTMPVLFDDCSFGDPPIAEPFLGKQRDLIPGMIASNWTPSPGLKTATDKAAWPDLEKYVKDVAGHFARDRRIVMWDLYNEPGNSGMGNRSLPLVEAAFRWAREAQPQQPLSVGVWTPGLADLNRRQIELSDVVTFHAYTDREGMRRAIAGYKAHKRPVVCTEWMARLAGSRWATDLPLLESEAVGCYSWGLVNGRMQCQFPWWSKRGAPEPKVWFHDLFHTDGRPYDPAEIEVIRKISGDARKTGKKG